jgi:hypothetical protein
MRTEQHYCRHLLADKNGGGSYATALAAATRAARNSYPQVVSTTAALVLTATAPYSHNLLPPFSQYLVLKRAMLSSWETVVVVGGYAGKVRAVAY